MITSFADVFDNIPLIKRNDLSHLHIYNMKINKILACVQKYNLMELHQKIYKRIIFLIDGRYLYDL